MSDSNHNLRQIAQVLKSNGTDGEVAISFRDIAPEDISTEEPVFIYFDGLPVPFFIESFTRRLPASGILLMLKRLPARRSIFRMTLTRG